MVVLALLAAIAWDLRWGEPANRWHPVAWLGAVIEPVRRRVDRFPPAVALGVGIAVALGIPLFWTAAWWLVLAGLGRWPWLEALAWVAAIKSTFAVRDLGCAAKKVEAALQASDLETARQSLSALCSRDASSLQPAELRQATIASIAENASDSAVAPFFFFAIGGLPAALAYRAVNTLDAMLGYRGRFEWLGKASARLDDVLNWVPARITQHLLVWHGARLGLDARAGRRIAQRDGPSTPSPNAGRPMAAMAGLLGIQLRKAGVYALGDARREVAASDIALAWRVARRTMVTAGLVAGLCFFFLYGGT